MNKKYGSIFFFFAIASSFVAESQVNHAVPLVINDSANLTRTKKVPGFYHNINNQLDIIDVGQRMFNEHAKKRTEDDSSIFGKPHLSVLPVAGYTLQTGFAAVLAANLAFYTVKVKNENVSSVLASITYSQYQQVIVPVLASIWTNNDKYNIVTDWRFLKYPSTTYGLGGYTSLNDGYTIDYSQIHLNQTIFQKVVPDVYFGLGYRFDHFWNVREVDPPVGKITDFESYGLTPTATASGITFDFLYDDRRNSINPLNGDYVSVSYWPNFTFTGANSNWQSLTIDYRKYIQFPYYSHNVIAFWSYDWFTFGGSPPYLLLPSTGGDPASNSGRGYIQGRFRGGDMLYAEGEYRFVITHNELLGGVIFANAESVSEQSTKQFGKIAPGYGLGLRLKLNKFSRTNLAVDYGFGTGGSGGFFVNLGEVF